MATRVGRRNLFGGVAGMALAGGLPMPAIALATPIRMDEPSEGLAPQIVAE